MASYNTYNDLPSLFFRTSTLVFIFRVFTAFFFLNLLTILLHLPVYLDTIDRDMFLLVNTLSIIIAIGIYIIEFVIILFIALQWANEYYEITPGIIRHKYGYLYRKENVYDCTQVQEITVHQSMWGRMFNFGTITITSPLIHHVVVVPNVDDPVTIMHRMHEIITTPQNDKSNVSISDTMAIRKITNKRKDQHPLLK